MAVLASSCRVHCRAHALGQFLLTHQHDIGPNLAEILDGLSGMGARDNADVWVRRLCGLDHQTPAAVIAAATTAQERILISTLDRVAADARVQGFEPPAVVIVGEIVAVRERIRTTTAADKAVR